MSGIAIYPGTFDPFTNGHLDIVQRSLPLFDKVVIAVSDHGRKNTLFDIGERCLAIAESVKGLLNVEVISFDGLLTECAKEAHASAIIRGLRVTSDFEYEFKMAQFISEQVKDETIEVVYLMAHARTLHISSSSVKELAALKGDVSNYVPVNILKMIHEKYGHA